MALVEEDRQTKTRANTDTSLQIHKYSTVKRDVDSIEDVIVGLN